MKKTYIASPFFNPAQCEFVDKYEKKFDESGEVYFSPRKLGITFQDKSPKERVKAIIEIFKADRDEIDACDSMVANCNTYSGKIDIGTLWEVGYYLGSKLTNKGLKVETDDQRVNQMIETLLNWSDIIYTDLENFHARTIVLGDKDTKSEDYERKLFSLNFKGYRPVHVDDLIESHFRTDIVFCIDEWPPQNFMLMGWMHAKHIPYHTVSFKGYGSNVMIAASSKGHLKLNIFEDELKNQEME